MERTYEIMLARRVVSVEFYVWDKIRDYVRKNKWFYIVYMGKKYKYTKDRTFYDRPTMFEFELVLPGTEEEIEILYI